VGPVRAQGQCHASWAFTTLGVMEASYKITYNKSVTLSPQQLIDCSKSYDTLGCNGGFPDNVIPYLQTKGVVT
jgi:cathepsin H